MVREKKKVLRSLDDIVQVQPVLSFERDGDNIPIWKDECIIYCDDLIGLLLDYLNSGVPLDVEFFIKKVFNIKEE